MKKKLSLDKKTITKLNDNQMFRVNGGNGVEQEAALTSWRNCTKLCIGSSKSNPGGPLCLCPPETLEQVSLRC